MRKGNMNSGMYGVDDQFVAINLGADFCAEHEWGIKDLRRQFGVGDAHGKLKDKPFGHKKRIIKNNSIISVRGKKYAMIVGDSQYMLANAYAKVTPENIDEKVEQNDRVGSYPFHPDALCIKTKWDRDKGKIIVDPDWEFTGAWSGKDFGILFNLEKPEAVNAYETLVEAFKNLDVIIMIGGAREGNPFDRGGLTLIIASRLPKEGRDAMYNGDRDAYKLKQADKKTGIKKKLEKKLEQERKKYGDRSSWSFTSQYRYHALSPRWFEKGQWTREVDGVRVPVETKYDVIYWLNPGDQENCYFGYVTVEDLEDWIEGEGFIVEQARSKVGS